mmetsp:Transcript_79733/g.220490  ORF Transcript_79733/g.220490 Transcript_79733/m.220490 type:complete len:225 (-) Transcript_79733:2-676(-)
MRSARNFRPHCGHSAISIGPSGSSSSSAPGPLSPGPAAAGGDARARGDLPSPWCGKSLRCIGCCPPRPPRWVAGGAAAWLPEEGRCPTAAASSGCRCGGTEWPLAPRCRTEGEPPRGARSTLRWRTSRRSGSLALRRTKCRRTCSMSSDCGRGGSTGGSCTASGWPLPAPRLTEPSLLRMPSRLRLGLRNRFSPWPHASPAPPPTLTAHPPRDISGRPEAAGQA